MGTIAENLQSILRAVYGRDVRTAIHDSIEQCYEDTEEGVNAAQAAAATASTAAQDADAASQAAYASAEDATAAAASANEAAQSVSTAISSASTAAASATSAALRANTAASAAEDVLDAINNSEGVGVQTVNNKSGFVTLTASDVGALPSNTQYQEPLTANVDYLTPGSAANIYQPIGEYLVADDISGKADIATTLAGYGITNAYTKTEVNDLIKADVLWSGSQDLAATAGFCVETGYKFTDYKVLVFVGTGSYTGNTLVIGKDQQAYATIVGGAQASSTNYYGVYLACGKVKTFTASKIVLTKDFVTRIAGASSSPASYSGNIGIQKIYGIK